MYKNSFTGSGITSTACRLKLSLCPPPPDTEYLDYTITIITFKSYQYSIHSSSSSVFLSLSELNISIFSLFLVRGLQASSEGLSGLSIQYFGCLDLACFGGQFDCLTVSFTSLIMSQCVMKQTFIFACFCCCGYWGKCQECCGNLGGWQECCGPPKQGVIFCAPPPSSREDSWPG